MLYFISSTYLQTPCQSTAQVLGTVAYFFITIVLILGLLELFSMWKLLMSSLQKQSEKKKLFLYFFKVNWKALTIKTHMCVSTSQHYEFSFENICCNFILCLVTWQYHSSVLLPQSKEIVCICNRAVNLSNSQYRCKDSEPKRASCCIVLSRTHSASCQTGCHPGCQLLQKKQF